VQEYPESSVFSSKYVITNSDILCAGARQNKVGGHPQSGRDALSAQDVEHWLELGLIFSPAIHGARMDFLADLNRACCGHCMVLAMKFKTGIFPRQFEIVDYSPRLLLHIGDNVFVFDIQKMPGQELPPIFHQAVVANMMPRHFLEVIGMEISFGKELFEARKAAVHGIVEMNIVRNQDSVLQEILQYVFHHLLDVFVKLVNLILRYCL